MRSSVHPARRRVAPTPPAPGVPVKALIVSAIGHLVIVGAFVALALWGMFDRPTVHVVNLFPSIAAVGTPSGSPAALPTRTPPPPAPTRAPEPEPKPREVAKPAEASLPSRTVAPKVGERDLPPLGMPS